MKSKVLLAFFACIVISFSQDVTSIGVQCSINNLCTDDGNSCGIAGVAQNWVLDNNGFCKVQDCTKLQISNPTISNYACTSCNDEQGDQQNNGNIFSNLAGTDCVNINCAKLAFEGKMDDNSCGICVGQGSKVNYDKSTCILPNSVLSSSIIQVTAAFLAYLFII
ncbi:hypothetical protein ABPG72_018753 [Tetrahymena utriculariae]